MVQQSGSKLVRIYAAAQCNSAMEILPAAKAKGVQVVLGIWSDTDDSFYADKVAVVEFAPKYLDQVYAITVGSETLYRGNFTGELLLAKMAAVKAAVPPFKIGIADTWNKFADGTADPILPVADIILCNAFSYWQGQDIDVATAGYYDDIWQAFEHIRPLTGSTTKSELWTGETSWPTAGGKYEAAIPGVANAAKFYGEAVCGMIDWGFNVFYFEAIDEWWKPVSMGKKGRWRTRDTGAR